MSVNHFGPGVVGQELYEEQKRLEESGANIFGPGILLHNPTAAAPASSEDEDLERAPAAPPSHNALSIPQLEAELKANPAEFDRLYRGEFARPDGGRKGAFGALLSHEQSHQNRAEVIDALLDLLKARK
jgi:hypothetical protein